MGQSYPIVYPKCAMISCSAVIQMPNSIIPIIIKFLFANRRRASMRKIRPTPTNRNQINRIVSHIAAGWMNIIGFVVE
jgi:hypothetical protein